MGKNLRNQKHQALMAAIVFARKRRGLTQRQLASRLGRAHSFVGKVESGERQLNVLEFCELANALDISPTAFLGKILRG
jgi:transcriptional regulator with XRE-family HTH domain